MSLEKKRSRRSKKLHPDFDPRLFTGKHTLKTRLADVGWFFHSQWRELKQLFLRSKRLSKDMLDELFSKLRS